MSKDNLITIEQLQQLQKEGKLEDYLSEQTNGDITYSPSRDAHQKKNLFSFLDDLHARVEKLEESLKFEVDYLTEDENVTSNAKEL